MGHQRLLRSGKGSQVWRLVPVRLMYRRLQGWLQVLQCWLKGAALMRQPGRMHRQLVQQR